MKKFNRLLAKRRLIRRYKYLVEVDKILEEYLSHKLLQGGSPEFLESGRKELIKKQSELRETESFTRFLKTIK